MATASERDINFKALGAQVAALEFEAAPRASPELLGFASRIALRHLKARTELEQLVAKMVSELVEPALTSPDVDAFWNFISAHLLQYARYAQAFETLADVVGMNALKKLGRESPVTRHPNQSEALKFAQATMTSAWALAEKLKLATARDQAADDALAKTYYINTCLHSYGLLCLVVGDERNLNQELSVGIITMLRGSALRAYAAAREAYDLRVEEPEVPFEPDIDSAEVEARAESGISDASELLRS